MLTCRPGPGRADQRRRVRPHFRSGSDRAMLACCCWRGSIGSRRKAEVASAARSWPGLGERLGGTSLRAELGHGGFPWFSLRTFPGSSARLETVSVADAASGHLRSLLWSGAFAAGAEAEDAGVAKDLGIARPTARVWCRSCSQLACSSGRPGAALVSGPCWLPRRCRPSFTAGNVVDIFRVRRLVEFEAVPVITTGLMDTADIPEAVGRSLGLVDTTGGSRARTPTSGSILRWSRLALGAAVADVRRAGLGDPADGRSAASALRVAERLVRRARKLLGALNWRDADAALRHRADHLGDAEADLMTTMARKPS